jgi:hypothetical protein
MSKIPSPEELRRDSQPIRTEQLLTWAKQAGFVSRNNGSSHICLTHSIYPDIRGSILADSKDPAMKRTVAKLFKQLEIRFLESQASDPSLQKEFKHATKNKIESLNKRLPYYIRAEHDSETGKTVLRDQHLPMIGLTLKDGEDKILENKVRYLENMKREAYELLNRHDIRLNYCKTADKEGSLSHAVYQMPKVKIEPYKSGDDPENFRAAVHAYVAQVRATDINHTLRLQVILQQDFIRQTELSCRGRHGERALTILCDSPTKSGLRFDFKAMSHQRPHEADIYNGRISERELGRMEKIIGGIGAAHQRALIAA